MMFQVETKKQLTVLAIGLGAGIALGTFHGKFFPDKGDGAKDEPAITKSQRPRKARSFRYRSGSFAKSEYSRSYPGTAAAYIDHLSELSIDQFEAEADYFFEFKDPLSEDSPLKETPYLLFAAWGSLDPLKALEYSKTKYLAERYDAAIFQGWVSNDPDAFFAYYRENSLRVEWERQLPAGSPLSYGYTCAVPAISNELKRSHPSLVEYWENRSIWRVPKEELGDNDSD